MKLRHYRIFAFLLSIVACFTVDSSAQTAAWKYEQHFNVAAPGLVKLSVPTETLSASRSSLEDLRVMDPGGHEVPFLVERPVANRSVVRDVPAFSPSLNSSATILTMQTGVQQPVDGVALQSPARFFIKAVNLEGSSDGRAWQPIVQDRPVFRQPNGASQLYISFPPGVWRWLRATLDDRRSAPVPFTAATIHLTSPLPVPSEPVSATISDRQENAGETRLTVNLGASNLHIAKLKIDTSEPLFMRSVTVKELQVVEDTIQEQTVAEGAIYRVAVDGQPAVAGLSVPVEAHVRSRELLVIIRNLDSPPLSISDVRVERRPVYVAFAARQSGSYRLMTGNSLVPMPRYDVAGLSSNLKGRTPASTTFTTLANTVNYRAPEVLPNVEPAGAPLDVAAWKFRKAVPANSPGAYEIEIDLDVLAHSQPDFTDLRLIRSATQVPYVLQRTSLQRSLMLNATVDKDPKSPTISRWLIQLPQSQLPLSRLKASTTSSLFQRDMILYEEVADRLGEKQRHTLGTAAWQQTPDRQNKEFYISIGERPESDKLYLETQNGDNTPITLENFQVFYPSSRLLFKSQSTEPLFLYYGYPQAPSARYDIRLVAAELVAAEKTRVSPGKEEQLKAPTWREMENPGKGGLIFWGALVVVVLVLLFIVSRLLPAQ